MPPHRLSPLFDFSSLAVVGASDSSSHGTAPFRSLQDIGFRGRYLPINPRREQVHGVPAYPDVSAAPESIDAATIVVGRDRVLPAVAACADRGARVVVIVSAGFAEADEEGTRLQQQLSDLARERDLLVIGPNCFGVASVVNRCAAFNGSGLDESRPGSVGVVSHSGGLLNEVISYGNARGIGFSHIVSCGNEAGVTAADVLDFYVDDPQTRSVLAIIETIRDRDLFVRAAERARAARKPIVVLKLGVSAKGFEAARTHTASDAGNAAEYDTFFREQAIIRVADIDELVEMGALLSSAIDVLGHRPLRNAAIIEISGGGKELVCDTAAASGVGLPDPSPDAYTALRAVLPENVEPSNPLDTGGAAWGSPEMGGLHQAALNAFATEPAIDIILSRFTVPRVGGLGHYEERIAEIVAARQAHPDRLFGVLSRTSDQFSQPWAEAVRTHGLAFLQGYGRGLRALGKLAEYSRAVYAEADVSAAGRK